MEKKKCAACGNPIESEMFLESVGEFFHDECWAKTNRERLGPLLKSKIEQRTSEVRGHLNYLKKFLLYAAIVGGFLIVELIFFQPSNVVIVIATFVTLCALLAAPIEILHVLREVSKKKTEIKKLESGTLF